ncbi:MAG: adenosine deaminase [Fimbriimonadaceae bacterium]
MSQPRTYAELHLHLGGAILPIILYTYLQRAKTGSIEPQIREQAQVLLETFPTYDKFERRLTKPCDTLSQYLEKHKLIEPIQRLEALPYLINRLLRGAFVFDHLDYLELRYNPFFRVPKEIRGRNLPEKMATIVDTVAVAAENNHREYPIQFTQILCMDSRLDLETNREILNVAKSRPGEVAAVDIAGPDEFYKERMDDFLLLLGEAKDAGLNVTAHLYETPEGACPELLNVVDRIGHGIQIPLRYPKLLARVAKRKVCLEVCPTTYFQTGSIQRYAELVPVFRQCEDLGIDLAICTDNSALHGVRLPQEYERLLTNGVIGFARLEELRQTAFRRAFRYKSPA